MTRLLFLAVTIVTSSCVLGDAADPSPEVSSLASRVGNLYDRVVLGRLYQTEHWMLPDADTYQVDKYPDRTDRRIHYVCDAIVKLEPTYVSGLIRLSWDTVITDEMRTIFRGVKECVRGHINHQVRFDVVLNARHYTEPRSSDPKDGVSSADEGRDRLRARLRTGNEAFDPEAWFFDFYTVPFNDNSQAWFTGAMRDGIDWIHHDKRLVGGNVWGRSVPDGTDFAAIPLIGGFDDSRDQIDALTKQVPTFVHIRNDPQVCDSEGLAWFTYTSERRGNTIATQASRQAALDVGYMYPLFFPLSATASCAPPGVPQVAYDAAADGMLARMRAAMDRYEYRPRAQ